jgi:hypothetical protein
MHAFICTTCGTQYAPSETPPPACVICEEERQFVTTSGQSWTTLERLAIRHSNAWRQYEPGLIGIGTQPAFGIGQRALLIQTPHGNVLWDCIALLDAATITLIKGLGGVQAMAISHPHFYTTMVEWARAFDVPVHVHEDDRQWIMRPDDAIRLWSGETREVLPGATIIRCGGHFAGSSALHWAGGAEGRGIVCTSDTATVAADRKFVSFMHSYPNLVPLPARKVKGIVRALAPFAFERIYGVFFDSVIAANGKAVLQASAERYLAAIGGGETHERRV